MLYEFFFIYVYLGNNSYNQDTKHTPYSQTSLLPFPIPALVFPKLLPNCSQYTFVCIWLNFMQMNFAICSILGNLASFIHHNVKIHPNAYLKNFHRQCRRVLVVSHQSQANILVLETILSCFNMLKYRKSTFLDSLKFCFQRALICRIGYYPQSITLTQSQIKCMAFFFKARLYGFCTVAFSSFL